MIIFYSIEQLKNYLDNVKKQQKIVGFVPTMGALHQGHISLIETARAECDLVVCSIFVNPTQFNDLNDLKNYPRTFEADCHLLEKAQCDVVFMPEISEIYTPGELDLKKQNIKDKTWTKGARDKRCRSRIVSVFQCMDEMKYTKSTPVPFNPMTRQSDDRM